MFFNPLKIIFWLNDCILWASLVAQTVKSQPAVWETWIRFLGWEASLGKGPATPLQYSCLENSRDRGAKWAIVHGVAVGYWGTFTFTSLVFSREKFGNCFTLLFPTQILTLIFNNDSNIFKVFSKYATSWHFVSYLLACHIQTSIWWHPTPVLLPGKSHGWRAW